MNSIIDNVKKNGSVMANKAVESGKNLVDKAEEKLPDVLKTASEIASKAAIDAAEQGQPAIEKLKEFSENQGKNMMKASAEAVKSGVKTGVSKVSEGTENAKLYVERQKKMKYKSLDSLAPIVTVVNEAAAGLGDESRTVEDSPIGDVLSGAIGAGLGGAAGGAIAFAALFNLGIDGLSAVGITSGLAAAGGTMVGGIFVLATPIAVGAAVGTGLAYKMRQDQLQEEKERLYQQALLKHEAVLQALENEAEADKKRIDYLRGLNILLQQAVNDLKGDLDIANE